MDDKATEYLSSSLNFFFFMSSNLRRFSLESQLKGKAQKTGAREVHVLARDPSPQETINWNVCSQVIGRKKTWYATSET